MGINETTQSSCQGRIDYAMPHFTKRLSPVNQPVDVAKIPAELKSVDRWVVWKTGEVKPNGKFGKIPLDCDGNNCNANDSSNWIKFSEAVQKYAAERCSGIGIVLSDAPISVGEQALYLTAIDLDNCIDWMPEIKGLWEGLGNPYLEVSPSGNGVRMFAFSRFPIKGGNAGGGREMYGSGRFMTVTGVSARGKMIDATEALLDLQAKWFPAKQKKQLSKTMLSLMGVSNRPETPENIAHVKDQLQYVSADCNYGEWRNVVWAILSTGWNCATSLARSWSETAPARFTEAGFDNVANSFEPLRGITLGTLDYMAQEGGWKPALAIPAPQTGGSSPSVKTDAQPAVRFQLLTVDDLRALPQMQWRIKGTLPARGLASIYGPSGSGKSFLAIDLACRVASGSQDWFGAAIKPAPVVYVALEGEAGIRNRIAAWEAHHQKQVGTQLRLVLRDFTLTSATHALELADDVVNAVGKGGVVIVDTLNQSAPGADENSSVDMGEVLFHAKELASEIEGVVVLVHHAGKDKTKGMRGHSSLFAAMDAVIEVGRTPAGREWKSSKMKEGEDGLINGFDLVSHCLGHDEDGDPIRSCAVQPVAIPAAAIGKPQSPPRGKHQRAALQALRSADIGGVPIARDKALQIAGQNIACDAKHRSNRAASAIDGLVRSGHLIETEGGLIPA